ncbi:MAG TPA: hypothetical protein VF230_01080 [Acidimicrobiales bacterium]
MRRRTLDILFSAGGAALAALLLVLGLVMTSNANFSENYVTDQLSQQNISFKPAAELTDEEKAAPCIVENAGKALTTGKQAECYANDFIGLHLKSTADGMTYADIGVPQSELRTKVAAAQKAGDPALADLQKQLADVTTKRETLFKGETLRGLLLTSYGFSELGAKANQAATVAYAGAALLALLAVFGFVHAFVTPRNKGFAVAVPDTVEEVQRLARV